MKKENKARQDMNLFMIHELRSPLSSIKAATSLLLTPNVPLDEQKKKDMLNLISSQALKLLGYVGLILDTQRMQSGLITLQKQPHDIKDLLNERISLLQPLAAEKHIQMSLVIDQPIPIFNFDKEYIGHAVDNLLYNSLKFTPNGGKITVTVTREEKFVNIAIQDSGKGMAPDQIKNLFKKFSKVDPKATSGTGLGLYFLKTIIENHGGHISVTSIVDTGSTFTISLPFFQEAGTGSMN